MAILMIKLLLLQENFVYSPSSYMQDENRKTMSAKFEFMTYDL